MGRANSRMELSGTLIRVTAHRPMRTEARMPALLRGLAPRMWAIIGDTAEAGPKPVSQVK